ncbi:hypothetical protein Mjas_01505 [Methanothermococcus sp. Ax23]|uniref:hypothetical protein n=1 Tax=Methanothermococcus sp. Ax23 TaxID=3156486 RepID=UPI003BA0BD89
MKVLRILFFSFLAIFLITFTVMSFQQSDDDIIKEKLLEFGYPSSGYIIVNETIRYPDGSFVVLSTPPKKYSIGGVQALNLARKYLDDNYNKMLEEHNYHLDVDPGSIEEFKDGNYYWQFKLLFGRKNTKGDFMGYVLVDRQSGYCKIQGLFG